MNRPFFVGISGGTASGKTSISELMRKSLEADGISTQIVSQDNFYKSLEEADQKLAKKNEYNFDHPNSQNFTELLRVLNNLKSGKDAYIPIYDHSSHKVIGKMFMKKAQVYIFEGIMLFVKKEICRLFDQKIFVDVAADTRLVRRIRRDIKHRNRDLEGVLVQYEKFVKPAFDELIYPTKNYADIIIPRGKENTIAIEIILSNIKNIIKSQEQHIQAE